jgi:ABC-type phosphate/phosphonate transport system substrate-binding protein
VLIISQVPSNGLGVRPDLNPELRRQLREALLAMNTREDSARCGNSGRFVATSTMTEPVFDGKQAGLDLAAWPREIH